MKWVFYVIVFVYMFYRAVYGIPGSILVAEIVTPSENDYFNVKDDITVSCKTSRKGEKLEWVKPNGDVVSNISGNRVYVQDHIKGRLSTLVMTIISAEVGDSGTYTCRSKSQEKNVSFCVFDPVEFVEPKTSMTIDLGRSVTLTCPTKGEPEPKFIWYKNGVLAETDEGNPKYRTMTQYSDEGYQGLLTVMSLESTDSGLYSCTAVQGTSEMGDCINENYLNITLNIRHAPIFDENETTMYEKNNQDVELVCSATAYPPATYKWFKDGKDVSHKLDGKLRVSDDKNESYIIVNSGLGFGQNFRCQASNSYGTTDKTYILKKIERPTTPSQVIYSNATDETIELQVKWESKILTPINGFKIQHITIQPNKQRGIPMESSWKGKAPIEYSFEKEMSDLEDVTISLENLKASTEYWVRLQAFNSAGASRWSVPIVAATVAKLEVDQPVEETTLTPEIKEAKAGDSTFYGIFFAGGILVVAVLYMFAMRMVK